MISYYNSVQGLFISPHKLVYFSPAVLAYSDLSEIRTGIEYHGQSLAISREIGDRQGEGNSLGNLGNACDTLGELVGAIEYYEQALKICREIGDRRGEGNCLFNMSRSSVRLGMRAKAIQLAKSAFEIFKQIDNPNAEIVQRQIEAWQK
jgi:tetratricopeptide (TPR) repeat protein